jgi:hypothetical protein
MTARILLYALCLLACLWPQPSAAEDGVRDVADELEPLYRFELLPRYRTGSLIGMASSFDRTGGNDDGFSGRHSFIRKEGERRLVLADLKGPGVVHRIWTPTPTDDPVAFYFDGEQTPRLRLPFSDLFSGKVFPFIRPIVGNEAGGYYSYIPIPFARSLKIVFEGERIQFHQIQYRLLPAGERIESFRADWNDAQRAALDAAVRVWEGGASPPPEGVRMVETPFTLTPEEEVEFFRARRGGRIVAFELEPAGMFAGNHKDLLLHAKWDDEAAIDAPAADFFGFAYGRPAMRGLLLGTRDGIAYSRLPMPYDESASLRLAYERRDGTRQGTVRGRARVWYSDAPRDSAREGKLFTTWRREIDPPRGQPYLLLEAEGPGHHVGTVLLAQGLKAGMTGFFEGDDVAEIDGEVRLHGTGSEDAFNGGWYAMADRWDRTVSLPLHGALDYNLPMSRTGGYRFQPADKSSFERGIRITIEHGPEGNAEPVDYTSLAFHYGEHPGKQGVSPQPALRVNPEPREHMYYAQLMRLTTAAGTTVENADDLVIRAKEDGFLRIMLDEVPKGRYRLYLSYSLVPDGTEFSVWQRQRLVGDWRPSWAARERRLEREPIGEVDLGDENDTVTIRTRTKAGRNAFKFRHVILERLD